MLELNFVTLWCNEIAKTSMSRENMKGKTCPSKLQKGDKIAIVSPATVVKEEYVEGAADYFRQEGYQPIVMPSAKGPAFGSYAATHAARLRDLIDAIENPDIAAILCARGGYGCVHLLDAHRLLAAVKRNPKWIVGFSDVSALHALWLKAGVMSIHGPMAKHITIESSDDPCTESLLNLLSQDPIMDYSVSPSPFNRIGKAKGELRGGNLAVLNGLASTPFDILSVSENEEVILFIEDISEAI